MLGLSDASKPAQIVKIPIIMLYACPAGLHVLVNYCGLTILSCLEYVAIGLHVSNLIFTDIVGPPEMASDEGKNMLVIGMASEVSLMEYLGMCDAFSVT
ncbi:unnamed protein product [Musa acuminata subsp. malaccensis]|uniref:(wild Malaysian banana) hypothetical protein n=1 Tax=Musa acuminata subsp. malaccensis TaxID=214687 RepID=A0A804ICU4_MUSAM|nr:unnamed protein product [Musa acuminata subsp. malaccensis]